MKESQQLRKPQDVQVVEEEKNVDEYELEILDAPQVAYKILSLDFLNATDHF